MCKMNLSGDSHKNSSNFLSSDKLFFIINSYYKLSSLPIPFFKGQ